tara:strand:+ start:180 stop:488 length:309 start_codon:yes stop_codon:yes gene_type:complete
MKVSRHQLNEIIRRIILEQDAQHTVPATHLILVGTPCDAISGLPNMWVLEARVTTVEGGTIVDTQSVRGATSAEDAIAKMQPWIEQMKTKYPQAKLADPEAP